MKPDPSESQNKVSRLTGSPDTGEPVFLVVGKLRRPHGVEGEILFEIITDFPQRLRKGKVVYVGDEHVPLTITSQRTINKGLLLSFENYPDVDRVAELTNSLVYVRTDSLPPLPEGQYYFHQLIGLQVQDLDGNILGQVTEIIETGATNVYVVTSPDGKQQLFPAIEPVIQEIDLAQGVMRVKPLEYL
jgi:16S rRNA processing protein RimM